MGCAAERVRNYRKRQERDVILLCQTDAGRCSLQRGLQGAVQRPERYLEVDDIVCGRLYSVLFENGTLQRPWLEHPVGLFLNSCKLTMDNTLLENQ